MLARINRLFMTSVVVFAVAAVYGLAASPAGAAIGSDFGAYGVCENAKPSIPLVGYQGSPADMRLSVAPTVPVFNYRTGGYDKQKVFLDLYQYRWSGSAWGPNSIGHLSGYTFVDEGYTPRSNNFYATGVFGTYLTDIGIGVPSTGFYTFWMQLTWVDTATNGVVKTYWSQIDNFGSPSDSVFLPYCQFTI